MLDDRTTGIDHPRIVLGFADRPFIVYEAYQPADSADAHAVRVALYDGAAWRYEHAHSGDNYGRDREYFNTFDIDITERDELHVSYTRGAAVTQNVYATRSSSGDWSEIVLPLDDVANAAREYQADGRLVLVADGLSLHQDRAGTWMSSTLPSRAGSSPGVRRAGDYLYVAYASETTRGVLMFARLPL